MKILTICPSIYPLKLATMMDSFLMTRSECNSIRVNYEIDSVTTIINRVFAANPDYDFYFVANDDCVFKTPEWDVKLARKGKITHGTDRVAEGLDGQFLMIDGDIVRALGWLQLPTLERYGGDVIWRFIGEQLGILEHVPEVIIEHRWEGADKDINNADTGRFAAWLPWAFKDIEKVRRALNVGI